MTMEKETMMTHPFGRVAVEMATRWGMVAAVPDGEDSAKRQKLRLMTPQELVDRAIESALALQIGLMAHGLIEISMVEEVTEEKKSE
jgi:hypothetical protein